MRANVLGSALSVVAGALALPLTVAPQSVIAIVTDDEEGLPVHGAFVSVENSRNSALVGRALTDQRGRVAIAGLAPGIYRVRVEMIGRATSVIEDLPLAVGGTKTLAISLTTVSISLEGLRVEAQRGSCSVRAGEGATLSTLWDEARKALSATAYTTGEEVYRYQVETSEYETDTDGRNPMRESRARTASFARTPYRSRPAPDLLANGFMQQEGRAHDYFAPDPDVLLSDDFLDTHCFHLVPSDEERPGMVGLGFRPTRSRSRIPDIAGTMWIDGEDFELEELVFRYNNLPWEVSGMDAGGSVRFRRLPSGTWIIPQWSIRMPLLAQGGDARGRIVTTLLGYRVKEGRVLEVTAPDGGSILQTELGSIEGTVVDGESGKPLPGARVGIVGSRQSIFTDAEGRFALRGLTADTYRLRFDHGTMRQVGYEPRPVSVEISGGEVKSVLLNVPSLAEIVDDTCSRDDVAPPSGTFALFGTVVREGLGQRPIADAGIAIMWQRAHMVGAGTDAARISGVRNETLALTTDGSGRFVACGVPSDRLFTVAISVEGEAVTSEDIRIDRDARASVRLFRVPRHLRRE